MPSNDTTRRPWNLSWLIGPKPPLKPKHIWTNPITAGSARGTGLAAQALAEATKLSRRVRG